MRTPAGQPSVTLWIGVDRVGVEVEAGDPDGLGRLLRAERELVVRDVRQTVLQPKPLDSQRRHDACGDRDAHVGWRPPEHVVDDAYRILRLGEVLEVVEHERQRHRGVVEHLEERVDKGERLCSQRRCPQWFEAGGELVEPRQAGCGQQVGDEVHGLAVGLVDGQPQGCATVGVPSGGGGEERRLAVAGHACEHDHRSTVDQGQQVRTIDEPGDGKGVDMRA